MGKGTESVQRESVQRERARGGRERAQNERTDPRVAEGRVIAQGAHRNHWMNYVYHAYEVVRHVCCNKLDGRTPPSVPYWQ